MNGILLIDKPKDWTSHDVVAKLRGILGERRIGHSGTLDPMATGLLVVFVGRATRAVEFAESHEKQYLAGVRFGLMTDTQDITGSVIRTSDKRVSKSELETVLPEFTGDIMQIPPMYSAIKVEGKKLYELARNGVEIERKSRQVNIKELKITGETSGDFLLHILCSKGTYIRTLCHDIGERLGTGAVLSSLRRTAAGHFFVSDAYTLEQIREHVKSGSIESCIIPIDSLFLQHPSLTISEKQKKKCLCGNTFAVSASDDTYRVYAEDGSFLMLGVAKNGIMSTIKSFFEV